MNQMNVALAVASAARRQKRIVSESIVIFRKEISGCSVVLNTSFNGPKEPIVEKPAEAINFLVTTKLDVLYLNGIKITRK